MAAQAALVLASLEGGDPEAIRAAYGIVMPDARKLVHTTLEAEDPAVRRRALIVLARNYREQELSTLVQAASDPDPSVRHLAIDFLLDTAHDRRRMNQPVDEGLLAVFAKAMQNPTPAIRELAERCYDELATPSVRLHPAIRAVRKEAIDGRGD